MSPRFICENCGIYFTLDDLLEEDQMACPDCDSVELHDIDDINQAAPGSYEN